MSNIEKKMTPAYVPFDTLEAFVAKLQKTTVPHQIHKTLLPNLSGAIQGHLLASLKFLTLTDDKGDSQEALHELVQAHGTAEWKPTLAKLLDKVYKPIIGDLNLKTAIPKTLQDKFKPHAEGETVEKCIRFYLKALAAAGVEVSAYLKVRNVATGATGSKGTANGKAKTKAKPTMPQGSADSEGSAYGDGQKTPPPGMMRLPLYIPGKPPGHIEIHEDLVEADVEMIADILKAMAKRRANKGATA